MAEPATLPRHDDIAHERTDYQFHTVALVLAIVTVLLIIALAVLWLFYLYLERREDRLKGEPTPLVAAEREEAAELPPQERLRRYTGGQPILEGLPPKNPIHPVGPWHTGSAQIQAEEQRQWLDSYGWVDREKDIVRVPLERAARLALEQREKYLPTRKKPE